MTKIVGSKAAERKGSEKLFRGCNGQANPFAEKPLFRRKLTQRQNQSQVGLDSVQAHLE
jgi:hypothetical protein